MKKHLFILFISICLSVSLNAQSIFGSKADVLLYLNIQGDFTNLNNGITLSFSDMATQLSTGRSQYYQPEVTLISTYKAVVKYTSISNIGYTASFTVDSKQNILIDRNDQTVYKANSDEPIIENQEDLQKSIISNTINYSKTWDTKNLNVSKFKNGDIVPEAITAEEWENAYKEEEPAWCYYNNSPDEEFKYGKLYNWYAVVDPRGLAPEGWRIPTNDEWNDYVDFLGGPDAAGEKIKSRNEWVVSYGTNSSGFNALPSGMREKDGTFDGFKEITLFWSSTEMDYNNSWMQALGTLYDRIANAYYCKGSGLSVRCIKE